MVEVTSLFSTCLSGNKVALAFGVGLCDNFSSDQILYIYIDVCLQTGICFWQLWGPHSQVWSRVGPETVAMFLLMMSANLYINISIHIGLYALLLIFFLSLWLWGARLIPYSVFGLRRSDIANPSNGNILVKVTLKMFVQSSSLGSVRGARRLRTTILSLLKEIRTYLCNYF